MNTKILMSLLIIGLTAMAVGGAMTGAYFSDTEESTGNTFTAGELDLTTSSTTMPFSMGSMKPDDYGVGKVTLSNAGTIGDAELDIAISAIANNENSIIEPEEDYDNTSDVGELGSELLVVMCLDRDQSGTLTTGDILLFSEGFRIQYTSGTIFEPLTINYYNSTSWDSVANMTESEMDDFVIAYYLPEDIDNSIMTDEVRFNITFTLEQAGED